MATVWNPQPVRVERDRFFTISTIIMALLIVAGFSLQIVTGRSSFAVPWFVHLHAVLFFGWTVLFVTQTLLVAAGSPALHRRLGWLAVGWVPAMVLMGLVVTVAMTRRGGVPFFFTPAYFLLMDPLALLSFAGLTIAAILLRRRSDWHRPLMLSGLAVLTGPGIGRLLPVPLLIPFSGVAIFTLLLLFPLAGAIRDLRRDGRVHPAWLWGIALVALPEIGSELGSRSSLGVSLYHIVTTGSPGATIDPQAYPPPPWLAAAKA